MALNINAFNDVSNGRYNEGFVDIDDSGKLAIHNNHVWKTDKNTYQADTDKNRAVRAAFLAALSNGVNISKASRALLRTRLTGDPETSNTPLTRREIREVITLARDYEHREAADPDHASGLRVTGSEAEAPEQMGALANMIGHDLAIKSFAIKTRRTLILELIPESYRQELAKAANDVDKELPSVYRLSAKNFDTEDHRKASGDIIKKGDNALAKYEEVLRDLYRHTSDVITCDALEELIDFCCSRESEIYTAVQQLIADATKPKPDEGADVPGPNVRKLVGQNAGTMHGHDDVMKVLAQETEGLRGELEALKTADPKQAVDEVHLKSLENSLRNLQDRLARLKENGIVYGNNEKVIPEKTFLQVLEQNVNRMVEDLKTLRHPDFAAEMRRIFEGMPETLARQRDMLITSVQDNGTIDTKLYALAISELRKIAESTIGYDRDTRKFAKCAPDLFKYLLEAVNKRPKEGALELRPGVLDKLMRGTLSVGTFIATYAYDLTEDLVDETLDDRFLVSEPKKIGNGAANTAWELRYDKGDGTFKTRVFKSEVPARAGLMKLELGKTGYVLDNRVIEINIASGKAAKMLGVPGVMVQSTAGVHKDQIGLFMEKAEGVTGKDAKGDEKVFGQLGLQSKQLWQMDPKDRAIKVGSLMKSSCDLEWVDWLTGQGDRHMDNVLVAQLPDGRMKMTGIDNDASFSGARIGRTRFVLNKEQASSLRGYFNVRTPLDLNHQFPGSVDMDNDGHWILDLRHKEFLEDGTLKVTEELEPKLAGMVKLHVNGLNNCALPRRISKEVYDKLIALAADKDNAVEKFIREVLVGRHFNDAQRAALRSRLDEMIAYAKTLGALEAEKPGHYILTQDQWESEEIVTELETERKTREDAFRGDDMARNLMRGYYERLDLKGVI